MSRAEIRDIGSSRATWHGLRPAVTANLPGVSYRERQPFLGAIYVCAGTLLLAFSFGVHKYGYDVFDAIDRWVVSNHAPGFSEALAWIDDDLGRQLFIFGLTFCVFSLGSALSYRGTRMRLASAADVLGRGPFTLFLRAFDEEESRRSDDGATYEQELAGVLRRIGPMICVGRPQEKLPKVGALRLYVHDAHWRAVVVELLNNCAAAVVLVSGTENLRWEIMTALRIVPPERLLLVVHSHKSVGTEKERQVLWERYRGLCDLLSGTVRLPYVLGNSRFLTFDPDGSPRLLPTVGTRLQPKNGDFPTIDLESSLLPFTARLSPPGRRWSSLPGLLGRVTRFAWQQAVAHPMSSDRLLRGAQLALLLGLLGAAFTCLARGRGIVANVAPFLPRDTANVIEFVFLAAAIMSLLVLLARGFERLKHIRDEIQVRTTGRVTRALS
jgi:hypothetical protein